MADTDIGYFPPEYWQEEYWVDDYWPRLTGLSTDAPATDSIVGNYPDINIYLGNSPTPAGWENITSDVLGPIKFYYGIRGHTPLDRLAITGRLRFHLDNFTNKGKYTPGDSDTKTWFEVSNYIMLSMQSDTNAPAYIKFRGRINKISPDAGEYGEGITTVDVVDYMDDLGRFLIGQMALQVEKTDGEVISAIINHVPNQPIDTDISLGRNAFTVANPVGRGGIAPPGMAGIKKAATSALGFGYIRGQASSDGDGGLFVYRDRHDRVGESIPLASFGDDPASTDIVINELIAVRDVDKIFNRIKAKTHPISIDSDIKTLWSLDGTPKIGASDGRLDIIGVYRDSDDGYSVVGGDSVVAPIMDCDYSVNANTDGTGINLLSNYKIIDAIKATSSDNLIRLWRFDGKDGDTDIRDDLASSNDGYYDDTDATLDDWGLTSLDDTQTSLYLHSCNAAWSTNCTDINMEQGTAIIWHKAIGTDFYDTNHELPMGIFEVITYQPDYIRHFIGTGADTVSFQGGIYAETSSSNGAISAISDTDFNDMGWNMFALIWDTDDVTTLNINGTDVGSATDAPHRTTSTQDIHFGNVFGTFICSGYHNNFALWNTALSTSDLVYIHSQYTTDDGDRYVDPTITVGGTETKFTFENIFSDVGYVTLAQVRGKRIKAYEPIIVEATDSDSINSYGERHLSIDLPYQDDLDLGQDAANAFLGMLKDPQTVGKRLRFIANQDSDALEKALDLEVGDAIKIKETQTNIDSDIFFINSASYELVDGRTLVVTYDLAPDDYSDFTINWQQTADFEEGDLSDFDVTFGSDISASSDAPKNGSYGLKCLVPFVGDTNVRYGKFTATSNETLVSSEFWLNLNALSMASDTILVITECHGSGAVATGNYINLWKDDKLFKLGGAVRNDSSDINYFTYQTIDTNTWYKIKFAWGASSGAGNDNGYYYLFINDELKSTISGIDNDGYDIDELWYGHLSGDSDITGVFYMDDIRWGIQG